MNDEEAQAYENLGAPDEDQREVRRLASNVRRGDTTTPPPEPVSLGNEAGTSVGTAPAEESPWSVFPLPAPSGFRRLAPVEVYARDERLVIVGQPDPADEQHNCDEMGCRSDHVILRARVVRPREPRQYAEGMTDIPDIIVQPTREEIESAHPTVAAYVRFLEAVNVELRKDAAELHEDLAEIVDGNHTLMDKLLKVMPPSSSNGAAQFGDVVNRAARLLFLRATKIEVYEKRVATLYDALDELVTLKDSVKQVAPEEYERRKEPAWEAARRAIGRQRRLATVEPTPGSDLGSSVRRFAPATSRRGLLLRDGLHLASYLLLALAAFTFSMGAWLTGGVCVGLGVACVSVRTWLKPPRNLWERAAEGPA